MIVYGIANCDTVKRARAWLDERRTAYTFHDFKKSGVPEQRLDAWLKAMAWEVLLNRRAPPGASSTRPCKPVSPTPSRHAS
jgi:arsenate reductase-like glutaredoxin family protein